MLALPLAIALGCSETPEAVGEAVGEVGEHGSSGSDPDASDAGSSTGSSNGRAPLFGGVEKGPFLLGASVMAARLDVAGAATGEVYPGEIENDLGAFDLGDVPLGLHRLEASGFHFDEVRGQPSTAPITLRALAELTEEGGGVRVNAITELTHRRILDLVEAGTALPDAVALAQQELVATLPIGLPDTMLDDPATALSLSAGDTAGARYLFAVSATLANAALLAAAGDDGVDARLQELMSTLAQDLRDDAALSPDLEMQWSAALASLDTAAVENNLSARFVQLGLPAEVPDLDAVLDQDRDGLLNVDDSCPRIANPEQADADGDTIGDPCDPYPYGDPETVVDEIDWPTDFVRGSDAVYFTTRGPPNLDSGTLWRAADDGGVVDLLTSEVGNPRELVLAAQQLYFFADIGGMQSLLRTDLAGTELVAIDAPSAYAFEADAEHLYWTDTLALRRRPHNGIDEILVDGNKPPYTNIEALGLGPNAVVFRSGAVIEAIDHDGGDRRSVTPFSGWAPGFAVDDEAVYWTEPDACVVRRASLDGNSGATTLWQGEPLVLPSGGTWCAEAHTKPALHGDHVYVGGTEMIIRIAREDGAAQTIATGATVDWVADVHVDDTHVWWMNLGCEAWGSECALGSIARTRLPD